MGSRQLLKLESLSERRAAHSAQHVERRRAEAMQLTRQQNELSSINREYQKTSDEQDVLTPAMLAHRRAFVTRLTEKIQVLKTQRIRQKQLLDEQLDEHKRHRAQCAAIAAVKEISTQEEALVAGRREQREDDDWSSQSLSASTALNSDSDHE